MNIINKLTLRQLQKNKKRTAVTVFGVVISVAMIMAVLTIGISFLDMFKRTSIEQDGAWEAQYKNVPYSKLQLIEEEQKIKDIALVSKQGVAAISDAGLNAKLNKSYIEVFALDQQAQEMYSIRLLEGRLPQTSTEIVIPEQLTLKPNQGMLQIGDQVTLNLGDRQAFNAEGLEVNDFQFNHAVENLNKVMKDGTHEQLINTEPITYTIVGVIKNTVWEVPWGASQIAVTALDEAVLANSDSIDIVGTTYHDKSRALFDKMKELSELTGAEYNTNHELLRYNLLTSVDSLQITLYGLTGIIMGIVIIGSVSLIFNAFGISVADRSKYLGMLASVGATKRQKRNSVFYEAAIISFISVPIGILGGYLGLLVTFNVINNILNMSDLINVDTTLEVVITPLTILTSIFVSLFTIFISAWLPARRASKITAIDAIRMSYDVKITKRQVKNNRLVRKIFGIEADIALKNLKRNKRRYQVTVFSLVISIVLFITSSYFTGLLQKGNSLASESLNYQVSSNIYHEKTVNFDRNSIVNHEGVNDYAIISNLNATVDIPEEHFSDSLNEHLKQGQLALNEDGTFAYNVAVYGLDDKSFKAYVEEQKLTSTIWEDDTQINAILVNTAVFNSKLEQKKIEDILLKNAQGISLDMYKETVDELEQKHRINLPAVNVANVVSEPSPWLYTPASMTMLMIVMPESQYDKLFAVLEDEFVEYSVYIQSDKPSEVAQSILEMEVDDVKMSVWNIQQYDNQMRGITLILKIFVYGFIALITFISIANIMNTISTGLQLRKREFAMLRSMGMTEKGFYRMINYESIFYGIKSLAYGIPTSLVLVYLMYLSMNASMEFKFELPWSYFVSSIVGIFIIVTLVMYYAGSKIKKGSIVESIKQENI